MAEIRCRSKKSLDCYDGKEEATIYGEDGQEEDGTWDGESVVCDACYIAIGQPSVPVDSPGARNFGRTIEGGKGPDETQRFCDEMNDRARAE
jgi:hypothetical protein